MTFNLKYKPYGNQVILIEWPARIEESILEDIINFKQKIKNDNKYHVQDLIIAYNSLTIKYHYPFKDFKKQMVQLKNSYLSLTTRVVTESITWHIPVCYNLEFGLDLKGLAKEKNLSITTLIDRHSNPFYKVYFIGFLPGFLYLGGLDKTLHCNRKIVPRFNITKGSVGIGGNQTGIYPSDSAGGWNIIGRTPISFFNASLDKPCFAKSGDNIKFRPIDKIEFLEIENKIARGTFTLKQN